MDCILDLGGWDKGRAGGYSSDNDYAQLEQKLPVDLIFVLFSMDCILDLGGVR